MASAGAGVWVDLELGERQEWEEEGPNPPRLDSLTPRFMDYSTCWNLATCGREEFAADVLVGLGPSVGGAGGCPRLSGAVMDDGPNLSRGKYHCIHYHCVRTIKQSIDGLLP